MGPGKWGREGHGRACARAPLSGASAGGWCRWSGLPRRHAFTTKLRGGRNLAPAPPGKAALGLAILKSQPRARVQRALGGVTALGHPYAPHPYSSGPHRVGAETSHDCRGWVSLPKLGLTPPHWPLAREHEPGHPQPPVGSGPGHVGASDQGPRACVCPSLAPCRKRRGQQAYGLNYSSASWPSARGVQAAWTATPSTLLPATALR